MYFDVSSESCGERMPSDSRWRVHGGNNLYFVVEVDELKVVVVEASVGDKLLEEGDELYCLILVWFGEVNIL
jgi:hypothetical protein